MLAPRSTRHAHPTSSVEQQRISRLVTSHIGYAAALAQRFARSTTADEREDLRQVAYLGLVTAATNCPAERESTFAAYAAATITGELKRHLRDNGWLVRPPRSMQELSAAVRECTSRLEQILGRPPLAAELADDLAVCVTTIVEALACETLFYGVPLEPLIPLYESGVRSELNALAHEQTEHPADNRLSLIRALKLLPLPERRALYARYVLDKSQTEIAVELEVSQMQVSRILRSGLQAAREHYGSLRSSTTV